MSWRSSAEWELRARVSPEMLAGVLVIVAVVALIGILGLAQSDGTEPAPGRSTAEPTASASRDPRATADTTSRSVLILDERIGEIAAEAGAVPVAKPFDASDAAAILRRLNSTVMSAQARGRR